MSKKRVGINIDDKAVERGKVAAHEGFISFSQYVENLLMGMPTSVKMGESDSTLREGLDRIESKLDDLLSRPYSYDDLPKNAIDAALGSGIPPIVNEVLEEAQRIEPDEDDPDGIVMLARKQSEINKLRASGYFKPMPKGGK